MVPTQRLAALLGLGLLPAAAAIAWPGAAWLALLLDGLLLAAFAVDSWRAPGPRALAASRRVEDVLSAGAQNPVRVALENLSDRPLEGELADVPPPGVAATGYRRAFSLPARGRLDFTYLVNPASRGDHAFGDLHLRVRGPWGLAARQFTLPAAKRVRAYPDLNALARDALAVASPALETGLSRLRRSLGEGREFESLREYLPGDDIRFLDWKATARRQKPITRQFEPERNQTVFLMIDCGRHMVSRAGERTKLDYAVDAALRLARVSMDRGDLVGVCAFGSAVRAYLPPRRGQAQLRALVEALYGLQPELVESDYDAAFDRVVQSQKRRSLVALFTDLLDEDSSRTVLNRTLHLRPRHLPLVVAAADPALHAPARAVPRTPEEAYAHVAARRVVRDRDLTVARLRDAGAHVVDASAAEISAGAINQYLAIKGRGLL